MLLFPWGVFARGLAFGFIGGAVLIALFLLLEWQHLGVFAIRPIQFVYFVAGVEIGVALVSMLAYIGLHALGIRWQQ